MELSEYEYLLQLELERHMYEWCLIKYGKMGERDARNISNEFYKYENTESKFRWLVFHDSAWKWAMLRIHGDHYWIKDRLLEKENKEYEIEYMAYSDIIKSAQQGNAPEPASRAR